MSVSTVTCECGAVYERTVHKYSMPDQGRKECGVCRRVLESWNSDMLPSYRLIHTPAKTPLGAPAWRRYAMLAGALAATLAVSSWSALVLLD